MSGYWQELGRPWHDTGVVHCTVCGMLLPRRAWRFDGGAGEIVSCGPECEDLYQTYWRPTYGTMAAGSQ